MIDFILKSTFCLALLYGVYFFFLEKEKMHHFKRFYLLFSLAFSLIVPFITFEVIVESVAVISQDIIIPTTIDSPAIIEEKTNYLPIVLWSLYGFATAILATRFILNLIKIKQKISTNSTEKIQNSTLVLLNERVLPHTFLNYVFINKNDYENRKIENELYTHELTHAHQKHTLDILFIEILKTIFWFNPMFILYKKAIQLNHEFLADEKVVRSYNNVPFYQNLLLEKASWNSNFYLASNLNFLVTKKRLIMMTKTASAKIMLLKKIALLPLFSGLVYFLCVETVAQQKSEIPTYRPQKATDKTRDEYFAGVQIKVYKSAVKSKNGILKGDIIIDKLYEELTAEEKEKYKMWLLIPKTTVKKSPTQKEFKDYKNSSKFAIWIDGKNVPNTELNNYKPEDIAYFSGSSVLKNARTKKHPQPFQFWFYTHPYFEKEQMGKEKKHYGGDLIEIFENPKASKHKTTSSEAKEPNMTSRQNKGVVAWEHGNKRNHLDEPTKSSEIKKTDDLDEQPIFSGGMDAFFEYISKNYQIPSEIINKKLRGKVFANFIIEKDGSISDIKILKDMGYGTGNEAERVLKNAPKWIPGKQNGVPVRVQYSLPITISAI